MTPFILVIFGATGDLAQNKLIPALFSLFKQKQLPEQFYIIGFARRDLSNQQFAELFTPHVIARNEAIPTSLVSARHNEIAAPPIESGTRKDVKAWGEFAKNLYYQQGTFEEETEYKHLISQLENIDAKFGTSITRIFYLATPPHNYLPILTNLHQAKLSSHRSSASEDIVRVAIEKPFGKDVETAKMLDLKLCEIFDEKQIFRVDHYLGKETVQNLLVFRFANSIFDPVWNKEFIDHVQITFAEKKGIAGRGKFFDGVGMLRDVAQNHLMQLLAAVVMEMPKSFTKEDVRDARAKAIQAIQCVDPNEVSKYVVRGQYQGYTEEKDVAADSPTETYIATKFFVETPRFSGVPFYMRAGKAMKENSVTISLVFKQTCHLLFKEIGCPEEGNVLTIRIQPNEGLFFRIITKTPGTKLALQTADMHFSYHEAFGTHGTEAYERLLLDIMAGDQMLFNRSDELASSWEFITTILEGWKKLNPPVYTYEQGENGPKEADSLIEQDGRKWI